MADLLSSGQKVLLRADGHKSKFYMSVSKPAVVLTGQVNNGSIARGATVIAIDNGISSDTSRVRQNQMLHVITAYGVMKVRVLTVGTFAGSNPNRTVTLTVDPNSIPWADNGVITVYEMYEPCAVQPTFNSSTGVSTKRGQTFSGQTNQPHPVARMMPHQPGFLSGSTRVVTLSGSGVPMTPGATISSYAWSSSAGTIASPTSQNTTLTLTGAQDAWVYLTVTDSNGKIHIGCRYVWAHSTDPASADYPYVDFEVSNMSLSFDGGFQIEVKVSGVADFSQFVDGALVVIWREAWYGSTSGAISLITNGSPHLFTGYIVKDSVTQDVEHGTVSFTVQSIIDVAKSLAMQALSIHAEATVQYWFQMPTFATMTHMLHWLLQWHSNLLELADWYWPADGSSTLKKKLFTFNEGSLGSQMADLAAKGFVQIGCNKAGQVYVERNIQFWTTAERAAGAIVSDITAADRRQDLTIVRREYEQTCQVEAKGFLFNGAAILPYCSIAPTKVRASRGSKKSLDGLIVSSQSDVNRLSGRQYAIDNNEYEEIRVKFAGDYSVIDVFPQRWWRITLTGDDTVRGIDETDMLMVPRVITMQLDPKNGALLVDAVFHADVSGPDGVTAICPSAGTAPAEGSQPVSWSDNIPGSGASALLAFS